MYNFDYYYPDDSYYNYGSIVEGSGVVAAVLLVVAAVLLVVLAYVAVCYIFNSIGLYTIAKNRGMKNPFLAFIPIANSYYLGKISDDINATMNKKSSNAIWLLVLNIIFFVLDFVYIIISALTALTGSYAVMGGIALIYLLLLAANVTYSVFSYISLYKIFKEYAPENSVLFLVLSILFGINAFFLFAIRNKKSGYQKWLEQKAAADAARAAQAQQPEAFTSSIDQAPVQETAPAEEPASIEEPAPVEEKNTEETPE